MDGNEICISTILRNENVQCEYVVHIYLLSNTIDLVHLELDECICVLS